MIKKPKTISLKTLRNKCDRKLQEVGRSVYDRCEICGGEYSCLHHVFPKSRSSVLRYHWDNCLALCVSCHFGHHNGDPRPHAEAIKIKGQEWFDKLEWKQNNELVKPSKSYYEAILENLEKISNSI